jgi:sialic acid synthase SpsE
MEIGGIAIEPGRVFVVAEIGNNHEGDLGAAREMVAAAAECGVDAVKFQTFRTELFQSPDDPARLARLRSFELTPAQFQDLHEHTRARGLRFLSTPLDLESADFLEPLVDAYKIASGDNDFVALLDRVARSGKPVVVSTGMSDLVTVQAAQARLEAVWARRGGRGELAVLHCLSSYPAPLEQVNLAAIPFLAQQLGCAVGYSDHTLGVEACRLAVAAGALIVEKHFTLDKQRSSFRDHQLSADPAEMKTLVQEVRRVADLLGPRQKVVQPCEEATIPVARRSLRAAADLPAGHRLRATDLVCLRPFRGLPPGQESRLLGRALKRGRTRGEAILPEDVE